MASGTEKEDPNEQLKKLFGINARSIAAKAAQERFVEMLMASQSKDINTIWQAMANAAYAASNEGDSSAFAALVAAMFYCEHIKRQTIALLPPGLRVAEREAKTMEALETVVRNSLDQLEMEMPK